MRLYGLQTGVADRNVRRFLVALASTLRASPRRRFCRACSASLLGCNRLPPEPCQNTFGDFQLIEFAAQFFPFGIKEVDDGIWIVSFMHYDLGFIDLEQKTLQPLDNPFGSRLLPMS